MIPNETLMMRSQLLILDMLCDIADNITKLTGTESTIKPKFIEHTKRKLEIALSYHVRDDEEKVAIATRKIKKQK